jgi:hypothetical protein
MFQFLKKVAAIVALVGCVGSAQAGPSHDFGLLTGSTAKSSSDFVGSFDDVYTFELGSGYTGVSGILSILAPAGWEGFSYRFGMGDQPSGLFSIPVNLEAPSFSAPFIVFSQTQSLPAGKYWFELKGDSPWVSNYSVTLAPVPEPESWALLLSGLGLMGFVFRRRSAAA